MTNTQANRVEARIRRRHQMAADVQTLSWAAEQLGIGVSTAYRIAPTGAIPGSFKVGGQWRVSVPKFLAEVHGTPTGKDAE